MGTTKQARMLEIFFRSLHGEEISVQKIASEYGVSTKSISRNINDLKAFLADHRELVRNAELKYSHRNKCYRLCMDEYLSNKELYALIEVIVGSGAFEKNELTLLIDKLKGFTFINDSPKINEYIRKMLYYYPDEKTSSKGILDDLWTILGSIIESYQITVELLTEEGGRESYRVCPILIVFGDKSFKLVAFEEGKDYPIVLPIKRIMGIVEHRKKFNKSELPPIDEAKYRNICI